MGLEIVRPFSSCCCGPKASLHLSRENYPCHTTGLQALRWKVCQLAEFDALRTRKNQNGSRRSGRTRYTAPEKEWAAVRAEVNQEVEIRVCVNKACRKMGSMQTLEVIRSLAPPEVAVEPCGCLGKCGNGPNLVILPVELMVSHCGTAAHAARLLAVQCGAVDPERNLAALALKEQANKAFEHGDIQRAEDLFSQAIEINPSGGLHFIYSNRSAARLARGDASAALEDAQKAASLAPQWDGALIRQAEAHTALRNHEAAFAAYQYASRLNTTLRRSKLFQLKVRELESKLANATANNIDQVSIA